MGKVKDTFVTDQEQEDGFQVDPEYDEETYSADEAKREFMEDNNRVGISAWTATNIPAGEIYKRIPKIMAAVGAVGKSQQNVQQRFKYRGIDDVYNALHSAMAENEVFTTSEILHREREERQTKSGGILVYTTLRIRYTFWTVDGSSVSTVVDGEGMDSGDKSSNKAMAVAHKYALLQAFMIPTEDQKDPDAESHEVAPRHDDFHKGYAKRQTDNFQKPVPNPDTIRALLACEDLQTLKEMWSKLDKSEHRLYEGVKEQRKEELRKLATVEDDIPQ